MLHDEGDEDTVHLHCLSELLGFEDDVVFVETECVDLLDCSVELVSGVFGGSSKRDGVADFEDSKVGGQRALRFGE